jgi:hypothetical protein
MPYKPRFPGPRWQIVSPRYDGVEKFAIDELQREMQRFLPYVVAVRSSPGPEELVVLLSHKPSRPQGFTLKRSRDGITIEGHDSNGVLYGVQELIARLRPLSTLDALPEFSLTDYPRVDRRGIWTWGYVVYDYRRFLDAMARLRLNTLTLWNDCAPANAREIIGAARARGIRLIFGFHWGWGTGLDLSRADHRREIKRSVLETFRAEYRPLDLDGIYFQTMTEHHNVSSEGRSTAAWACELVNDVAAAILEEKPGLRIEFGLHATSILDRYIDLKGLDPRVTIVWEDAGVIPFSYNPVTDYADAGFAKPQGLGSIEATLAYSKKISSLQPEFALVPKGWINLDWDNEFEHHAPFVLGERNPAWIRARLAKRQPRWDHVNALWLKNYPHAARFYGEFLGQKLSVSGLIEDGMLEERIQPSVALFAETLWNPARAPEEILQASYFRTPP